VRMGRDERRREGRAGEVFGPAPIHIISGYATDLAAHVNRAINDRTEHTAGRHLLSVFQAATNTEGL